MRCPIGSSAASVCSGMAPRLNSHASRRSSALLSFPGAFALRISAGGGGAGVQSYAAVWAVFAVFAVFARPRYARGGLQLAATSSTTSKHNQRGEHDPSIQATSNHEIRPVQRSAWRSRTAPLNDIAERLLQVAYGTTATARGSLRAPQPAHATATASTNA